MLQLQYCFPTSQGYIQGHTAPTSQRGNPSAASREKVSDRFIGRPGCEPTSSEELLNTRLLENADELFDAEYGAKKSQALRDKNRAGLQW